MVYSLSDSSFYSRYSVFWFFTRKNKLVVLDMNSFHPNYRVSNLFTELVGMFPYLHSVDTILDKLSMSNLLLHTFVHITK